jgi:hypothetical protein
VDSTTVTILTEARAAGLEVRAERGRLVVRGPRSLKGVAYRLLARKHEVLALLTAEDIEVAWRVAAMRPQVPQRGAIPVLAARDVVSSPGYCISCGEPLPDGMRVRCAPCARATWVVLHEIREDVTPDVEPDHL